MLRPKCIWRLLNRFLLFAGAGSLSFGHLGYLWIQGAELSQSSWGREIFLRQALCSAFIIWVLGCTFSQSSDDLVSEGQSFDSKGSQTVQLSLLSIYSLVPLKIECPSTFGISPLLCIYIIWIVFSLLAAWFNGRSFIMAPPRRSCIIHLSTVYEMEKTALSLIFILSISSIQQLFFEHHYVPCTVVDNRNAMVNESGKVPVFIYLEWVSFHSFLRDIGQEYGEDGCYLMEGKRKEKRYPVLTDFTFPASAICSWSGSHKLEVSQPLAGIQLLQRPSSPQHTPWPQYSSGRRRCCLLIYHSHGWKISWLSESEDNFVILFQLLTLSFFPAENYDLPIGTAAGWLRHQAVVLNSQVQDWI